MTWGFAICFIKGLSIGLEYIDEGDLEGTGWEFAVALDLGLIRFMWLRGNQAEQA